MWVPGQSYKVILFYRYVQVDDVTALIASFRQSCEALGLLGRVLVSHEGVNGTLAGSCDDIDQFVHIVSQDIRFQLVDWKSTVVEDKVDYLPFLTLSVREVEEIISCGEKKRVINDFIQYDQETFGGIVGTGEHLTPADFHKTLQEDDCVVLDIRNEFEYDIGHFEHAIGVGTFNYAETFVVLDELVDKQQIHKQAVEAPPKDQEDKGEEEGTKKEKKILMYCTGGIRCEKASAYLRAKGMNNVYQLKGGIHRYLEEYPDGGKFLGKNFVFDSRVSVGPATATDEASSSSCPPSESSSHVTATSPLSGKQVIVGQCIDCRQPHDVYSGFIVCTVCRMPVLVCPSCVSSNPTPGEFYCSRHRDFQGIYFTVLERFSYQELQTQQQQLEQMLQACHEQSQKKIFPKVRVDGEELLLDEDKRQEDTQKDETTSSITTASKNRRRTIRKQLSKIKEYMETLQAQAMKQEDDITKTFADLSIAEKVDQEHSSSEVKQDNIGLVNPKVKDGWGFWRT